MTLLRITLCGLLFFTGPMMLASVAQAEIIERVVAVVNDEALFLSDLRQRSAPLLLRILDMADEQRRVQEVKETYKQVLDGLIQEELLRQAATRLNIRVTEADVEAAIRNIRVQNQMSMADFQAALANQGIAYAQYRQGLKRQLLRYKVVNQRVRTRVNVTEEEIKAEYDMRARQANRVFRFHPAHIFFPLAEDASAPEVAARMREAKTVRVELSASNFLEYAETYDGGDLGWLSQGDLPEALEEALLTLAPGEISPPVHGPQGVHLLLLYERERGAKDFPAYDDMRDDIYRDMMESSIGVEEKKFLEELKRKATIKTYL